MKYGLLILSLLLKMGTTVVHAQQTDLSQDFVTSTNGFTPLTLRNWFANTPTGLGTAAGYNIGILGNTIPLLSTANTWSNLQTINGGIVESITNGTVSDQTNNIDMNGQIFSNTLITGQLPVRSYSGGNVVDACIVTTINPHGDVCGYFKTITMAPNIYSSSLWGSYQQGVDASSGIGLIGSGESFLNATSGGVTASAMYITSLCNPDLCSTTGELIQSYLSTQTVTSALQINSQNTNRTPVGFQDLIFFDSSGGPLATDAYIADHVSNSTITGTVPHGTSYTLTTFTGNEYQGPSFSVGPTITAFNSRIQVNGSALGAPNISVVGVGITPAINANIDFEPLGNGVLSISGIVAVGCPAGTVNLTTFTVTKGIITHC